MYFNWVKDNLNENQDCLEIGCASGYFLAKIKDNVKSVTGVETHTLLREYCQEIGIETFESIEQCPSQSYDCLFMFFVLEHLSNPIDFLANLKRLLKPNGLIFIVVPNVDDILVSTYEIKHLFEFYFTPAHQFYYAPSSLETIFQKAGLLTIQLKLFQRYDLSNHMWWMMHGKPGGQGKFNSIFTEDLQNAYANCLIEHHVSDTIFAIATIYEV